MWKIFALLFHIYTLKEMFTIIVLLLHCLWTAIGVGSDIPEIKLPLGDIVRKHGYPFEEHKLTTSDGYMLMTHRVPHGRKSSTSNKKPILLVHGMSGCSENFFILGPGKALAYLLAEHGYDVWVMNARGSFFSRKHKYLNPDVDEQFWKFSWHEIGVIDVALNIDYILNLTNRKNLYYLGHSQGSTVYFVLTSEKPEYNEKIKMHVSLAPPVFLNYNINKFGTVLCQYTEIIVELSHKLNLVETFPPMLQSFIKEICSSRDMWESCSGIYTIIGGGGDMDKFNKSLVPWIYRTTPSGMSIYQAAHYLQIVKTGLFRQYDYGVKENLNKYNSKSPPEYNLQHSTAPVILFYSENDWFASEKSSIYLSHQLPNVVLMYKVPIKDFNHLDFVVHCDSTELVYDPLFEFLDNYLYT